MTVAEPDVAQTAPQWTQLSLFDATSIIVGIIIGSAIYEITPLVAASASDWVGGVAARFATQTGQKPLSTEWLETLSISAVVGLWLVGGLLALVGAMCYAELATAYPHAGGSYVFLSEGLGRSVGFAFAWCEFWIVRPGNVGAIAFVMAKYGVQLLPARLQSLPYLEMVLAAGAILLISLVNLLGMRASKWMQNVLTVAKLIGLLLIVVIGLSLAPVQSGPAHPQSGGPPLSVALILIMFAYGGWTDMSFIAAEVRDGRRNIFRALVLGTLTVAAIYIAVNLAFIHAEGLTGLARSEAVAANVLTRRLGSLGGTAISLLVVISCLGAINGMIFTGARVYFALGRHHPMFRWLGAWNETSGVPLRSLVLQSAITLSLVIVFGLSPQGFERLVVFTGPFYWGFIGLAGLALIALRERQATAAATYRVPFFPLLPAIFVLSCAAMTYAAVDYAVERLSWAVMWAVAVSAVGAVLAWLDFQSRRKAAAQTSSPPAEAR